MADNSECGMLIALIFGLLVGLVIGISVTKKLDSQVNKCHSCGTMMMSNEQRRN